MSPALPAAGFTARPLRPALTLTARISLVFGILLLVAIANAVVVRSTLAQLESVAATVNMAGTLRYLSQKIALGTAGSLLGWADNARKVQVEIAKFEAALVTLAEGGQSADTVIPALKLGYKKELEDLSDQWAKYRQSLLSVQSAPRREAARLTGSELSLQADAVLASSDRLVESLTRGAKEQHARTLNIVYLLVILDAVVFFFVLLYMRARVARPLRALAQHTKEVAKGRFDAQFEYRGSDELGQLTHAFNDSARQIGILVRRLEDERTKLMRAESMFRGVAENSVVGVYVAQDGRFKFVNEKMADMFGYDTASMLESVNVVDLVPERDRALVESNVQKRIRGEVSEVVYERRAVRRDGTQFDVEVYGSTMALGDRPATLGIMLDVSRRKEAEATMRTAAIVYEHSSEAMTITDPNGVILDVNPAFTRITGYEREEAVGQRITILRSGRQDAAFYKAMWSCLLETGQWQGEIWNRRKNGDIFVEWLTINTAFNEDGSVFRRVALFYDITKKKSADELVWRQANFDALTNLPNRLMFLDRLKQEIRKAHRNGSLLALAFIDLDRFKDVNDSLGHSFGDLLLQQTVKRLQSCVRESDTVSRLGGDEFTLILPDLNRSSDVERIAATVVARLSEPFRLGDEIAHISASIGVTFFPNDGSDPDTLLKNADQAMYAAKALGRSRIHLFTTEMNEAAQSRRRIATDLRSALARGELELHYQPIFSLKGLEVTKAEALLRWRHPQRGLVSPAEFIPIAEDTGLIEEIGDWVFHEATRNASAWRNICPEFQVSVNTSPIQYRNDGLPLENWFHHLRSLGMPCDAVTIEITESLVLETSDAIVRQLRELRRSGMQVALDDFGTGYSSLSYLSKLDIDFIKIDRSFVSDLEAGSPNAGLCEAIVRMAHTLGIRVVAEGIETEEQRTMLANFGCDFGQGYLLSPPRPAGEFTCLLEAFNERNLLYNPPPGSRQ